nr:unnamed protein product [Callosobruchus analis]
MFENEKF